MIFNCVLLTLFLLFSCEKGTKHAPNEIHKISEGVRYVKLSGNVEIDKALVIGETEFLEVLPGTKIIIKPGGTLKILGQAQIRGTIKEPIVFEIHDNFDGIYILGDSNENESIYNNDIKKNNFQSYYSHSKNLIQDSILDIIRLKEKFVQVNLENIIFKITPQSIYSGKSIINIDKSTVVAKEIYLENVKGYNIFNVENSTLKVKGGVFTSCLNNSTIYSTNSFLLIDKILIETACSDMAIVKLGDLFPESITSKNSKIILTNSTISKSGDDAIDASDYSRVISISNQFQNVSDNSFDLNSHSELISIKDRIINSGSYGYSFTNSMGLVQSANLELIKKPCIVLKNGSIALVNSFSCEMRPQFKLTFDIRKCFKDQGPCSMDLNLSKTTNDYLNSVNRNWASISLEEKMSFGGEFKDALIITKKSNPELNKIVNFAMKKYEEGSVIYTESNVNVDESVKEVFGQVQIVNKFNVEGFELLLKKIKDWY